MTRAFLDSNVLIYAFSDDDPRNVEALRLLGAGGLISVQCLNEFASVVRRKGFMEWPKVHRALTVIGRLCTVKPVDVDVHQLGLRLAERYKLSIYDGMIVSAAVLGNCDMLWSEDMHHGLEIDGLLTIRNPFR